MSRMIIIKGNLLCYFQGNTAASPFHLLLCKKKRGREKIETYMKYICTKDLINLIISPIMLAVPSEKTFTLGFHHMGFKQAN